MKFLTAAEERGFALLKKMAKKRVACPEPQREQHGGNPPKRHPRRAHLSTRVRGKVACVPPSPRHREADDRGSQNNDRSRHFEK